MNFSYKAVDPLGQTVEGALEAPNELAACSRLGAQGLTPIRLVAAGQPRSWRPTNPWSGLRRSERLIWTQQMRSLLESGISLDRALQLSAQGGLPARVTSLIERIRSDVLEGQSLSRAIRLQKGSFDRLYAALVETGEGSGDLASSFAKLEEHLEAQQEIRSAVVGALIYPAFLTLASTVSVGILMVFVVPKFTKVLTDTGRPLPLLTQIVLGTTDFLARFGGLAAVAAAALLIGARAALVDPGRRRRWDGWKLRWPLVGDLIRKIEVTRFARTLATLLRAGVPLLAGLRMVREVISNAALRRTVELAAESLKEGQPVSGPLGRGGTFPRPALQMMAVGEETGQLDAMLEKIAQTYHRETGRTVKRLVGLMEPVVILVMGLIVGLIVIGILLGIVAVNDIPI